MAYFDKSGDRGGRKGGFGSGGGRDGGRPSFPKKSWGDKRGGSSDTVMHKAVCSECGKTCEVPFRPTGDKPVYCKDCFGEKKSAGFRDSAPKREYASDRISAKPAYVANTSSRSEGVNNDTKKQLDALNAKLDRLISAVEGLSRAKAPETNQIAKPVTSTKPSVKIAKKPAPKKVVKKAKK